MMTWMKRIPLPQSMVVEGIYFLLFIGDFPIPAAELPST
jgi:hypothetical protein